MASRFQVLQMALDEVAKRAPKVVDAVGDVAKKVDLDSAKQAVQRVADDVVEAADDWGWKGGKPGEVTAGSLKYDYPDLIALGKQLSQNPEKPLAKIAMSETVEGGVKRPRQEWEIGASVIDELKALEEADVPREWTGKVAAAAYNMLKGRDNQRAMRLLENPRDFYAYKQLPERLSRAMRPMTNDQRETFLALLPEWTESLDDLVNAVKTF